MWHFVDLYYFLPKLYLFQTEDSRLHCSLYRIHLIALIILIALLSVFSVLPHHFGHGKSRTSYKFQDVSTLNLFSGMRLLALVSWQEIWWSSSGDLTVLWQPTGLFQGWQRHWPARAPVRACDHLGEGQWGGPGTLPWAEQGGDLTCGTCCLRDHGAGRHRTCRQSSAGCACSRGRKQETNRMSAALRQGQGPRPQCADNWRPGAILNRERIAVHRTGHPGSLWPVTARQELSPHLEKFSWRTYTESWKLTGRMNTLPWKRQLG